MIQATRMVSYNRVDYDDSWIIIHRIKNDQSWAKTRESETKETQRFFFFFTKYSVSWTELSSFIMKFQSQKFQLGTELGIRPTLKITQQIYD